MVLVGVGKHLYQFLRRVKSMLFVPPGKEKSRSFFTIKLDDFDLLHDIFRGKVSLIFCVIIEF